ncbi:MAG: NAD(P)-dependent dehydrogenase, short-chain alcohol dehydrogenase family [Chloroflexi bacterium]|jgi:NAD(P)-dependent dehydrogenase (short-subunit alcohol dehydrogenase family)|nr:MAG: NAD(P)-dependent dehydrogenase, short-chain alcohol dehydrogenase family [Chloroflexota bacterium]
MPASKHFPPDPASPGRRLEGKVAIVTGAGSRGPGIGNGRAAAICFARAGARVLLVDRDIDAAQETLAMIDAEGGEALTHQADVTTLEDCQAMVQAALDRWQHVDVLHNNVGISGRGTVVETDLDDWNRVLNINVTGMMLASKATIPAMTASGGGSIINISSIAAMRARGLTPYTTSKGAVIALTKAMAVDHGRDGIRVNCIAPGPVYTPMVGAGGEMPADLRERRRLASVLEIEGSGWDIGYAALFLASDEARYITGVVLPVDGGVLLRGPAR